MKYTILPIIVLIVVFLPIVLLIDIIDNKSSKKLKQQKGINYKINKEKSNTFIEKGSKIEYENLLIKCKACNNKISKNAKTCPHCGEPIEYTEEQLNKALDEANAEKNWKIIGIIVVIIVIAYVFMNGGIIPLFTIEGTMTVEPVDDQDIEYDFEDDSWDY